MLYHLGQRQEPLDLDLGTVPGTLRYYPSEQLDGALRFRLPLFHGESLVEVYEHARSILGSFQKISLINHVQMFTH